MPHRDNVVFILGSGVNSIVSEVIYTFQDTCCSFQKKSKSSKHVYFVGQSLRLTFQSCLCFDWQQTTMVLHALKGQCHIKSTQMHSRSKATQSCYGCNKKGHQCRLQAGKWQSKKQAEKLKIRQYLNLTGWWCVIFWTSGDWTLSCECFGFEVKDVGLKGSA